MTIDLTAMFVLGFLSSFSHCYGMCGGFVMAYSVNRENGTTNLRKILPHLMYNFGRVLTYGFLGFWLGLLGGSFKLIIADFQSILFIFAGMFMSFMGIDLLGLIKIPVNIRFPGFIKYKQFIHYLLNKRNNRSIFLYGLTLGFIPCGLVYIAGAEAIASSTGLSGILLMLSFGAGTVPALFLLGFAATALTARFRNRMIKFAAILLILFGLFTVMKGVSRLMEFPLPWMKHSSMEHHHG